MWLPVVLALVALVIFLCCRCPKRPFAYSPDNLHSFINDTIIPFFKDQRSSAYQFAVLLFLSDKDVHNITDMNFYPSDTSGQPICDRNYPSMPLETASYGNYIVARPVHNNRHSEEVIFGKYSTINSPFDKLWRAYVNRNGTSPKSILLYSWNQPCARCTDVIIRALEDKPYRKTEVIVVHTRPWSSSETERELKMNRDKLTKMGITVKSVACPRKVLPA